MKRLSRLGSIGTLLVFTMLMGGITWAFAHGGDVNLIHACVNSANNDVKIVGANDTCKNNWTPLDWGIIGPSGPQGEQGPQGIQGEPGDAVKADPPCFDNLNRYVDCGNGTVTDQVTGLIWLQNANCFGLNDYAAANDAAAGLAHGVCDLTDNSASGDWRLPTEAEWRTTIAQADALGCVNPNLTDTAGTGCFAVATVEDQPFTGVQSFHYWSSSTWSPNPPDAWNVAVGDGTVGPHSKPSPLFVWPVRGGQ